MGPVFQCCFCLDRIEKGRNTVGQEKGSDYEDIIECSKGLLKDKIERDFSLGTSLGNRALSLCTECFKSSEKMYKIDKQLTELEESLKLLIAEFVDEINLRVSNNTGETYILEDQVKVETEEDLPMKDENSSTDCGEIENQCYPFNDDSDDDPLTFESDIEDLGANLKDDPLKLDNSTNLGVADEPNFNPRVVLTRIRFDKNGKFLNPEKNALPTNSSILGKRNAAVLAYLKLKAIASECAELSEDRPSPVEWNTTIAQPNPPILYANPIFVTTLPLVSEEVLSLICNTCGDQFSSLEILVNHKQTHNTVNEITSSTSIRQSKTIIGTALSADANSCDICGKPLTEKLNQHRMTHNGEHEKAHTCPVCYKGFNTLTQMEMHSAVHLEKKAHKCEICGRGFNVVRSYRAHKKLHKKGLSCRQCNKVCRSKEALIRHTSTHLPNRGKLFKCSECGKQFLRSVSLRNHVRLHKSGEFNCCICGKICSTILCLRNHERNTHKINEHYVCDICGLKTTIKFKLKRHIKIVHQKIFEFQCATCGREFGIKKNLQRHEETHKSDSERKKYDCSICSDVYPNATQLLLHKAESHTAYTTGFIYCDKCECKFINGHEMVKHMRKSYGKSHITLGPTCTYCKEIFVNRCHLLIHLANFHPAERNPHKCETCHAIFRTNTLSEHAKNCQGNYLDSNLLSNDGHPENVNLAESLPKKHKGEKAHLCSICGKSFAYASNLKTHEMVHSAGKRYSCSTCGKSFTYASTLSTHETVHSGKRYSCSTCGKSFAQSANLKTHLKTHSAEKPFSCSTCGRAFSLKANLVRHERMHTGEKPFLCNTCGKSFRQSTALRTHERLHTGEKPYSCTICGKSFSDFSTWSKHKKTHNP